MAIRFSDDYVIAPLAANPENLVTG
jgi:hypothetical protein